jgi:glycopeptide antibiotics resistance protein
MLSCRSFTITAGAMLQRDTSGASHKFLARGWSNRILLVALSGIFFLTMYPFEFFRHASLPDGRSPFLLGPPGKGFGHFDVFLNVLLFIPLGFGLAAKLRLKTKSWLVILASAWFAGALLSYCIEFLQLYIPARDSGWEDVLTNSTGSAIGCLVFLIAGIRVFYVLAAAERAVETWLSPWRTASIIALCFSGWAFYSIHLQAQSHLETWNPQSFLVFNNDATGRHPWKGKLLQFDIWDRAVDFTSAQQIMVSHTFPATLADPLAGFDFSSLPVRQEHAILLVPLSSWFGDGAHSNDHSLMPAPLIASSRPATDLVAYLKRSNQFCVRALISCQGVTNSSGQIFSLSTPSGVPNLYLGQANGELLFWYRNQVSIAHPGLIWEIPKLLAPGQTRDLVLSFDGSDLCLCAAGRDVQCRYWGPGTAFAALFRHIRQNELNGYRDLFYAVVFVPLGSLFGFAARRRSMSAPTAFVIFCSSLLLTPFMLEFELAVFDGRHFSFRNFGLSLAMVLAGLLWINSDRPESTNSTAF